MSVYLVGAGPGYPGLITVRGLELVRACEILVYDRLVALELVDEAPREAVRIAREPLSQAEINELLVAYGRAGFLVVRLKGGDPFVFGRGGEEALALAEAGVPFEVVPGVSSIAAVPAAAGIPITHRGVASQFTAVAAHAVAELDYGRLASTPGTLLFFMGLAGLDVIARGLMAAGRAPETPAAVIASGTTPGQRAVAGTLVDIAARAEELEPPALVVVGEAVTLRERLGGPMDEGSVGDGAPDAEVAPLALVGRARSEPAGPSTTAVLSPAGPARGLGVD